MKHHSSSNSSTDVVITTPSATNWDEFTTDQSISSDQTILSSYLISYHDSKVINCIIRCNVWLVLSQPHHLKSSKSKSKFIWSRFISIRLRNFHWRRDILLQWYWSRQSRSSYTQQVCDLSSLSICSPRHRGLWSVNLYTDRFRTIHRESSQAAERINVKNSAWLLLFSWILSWSRQQKKNAWKFHENDQSWCWIRF
jgi:hypothetical protein